MTATTTNASFVHSIFNNRISLAAKGTWRINKLEIFANGKEIEGYVARNKLGAVVTVEEEWPTTFQMVVVVIDKDGKESTIIQSLSRP